MAPSPKGQEKGKVVGPASGWLRGSKSLGFWEVLGDFPVFTPNVVAKSTQERSSFPEQNDSARQMARQFALFLPFPCVLRLRGKDFRGAFQTSQTAKTPHGGLALSRLLLAPGSIKRNISSG